MSVQTADNLIVQIALRTHQNNDIAVLSDTTLSIVLIPQPQSVHGIRELFDPVHDHLRLAVRRHLSVNGDHQFTSVVLIVKEALIICFPIDKFCPGIILNITDIAVHDLAEHLVDRVDYLPAAPEILLKIDPVSLRFLTAFRRFLPHFIGIRDKRVAFADEQFRSRLAETVNALLYIADHKHVRQPVKLPRNCAQNILLKHVGVLVLIDHDLGKFLSDLQRRLRWLPLLVQKNAQRQVRDRRKIIGSELLLLVLIPDQHALGKLTQNSQCLPAFLLHFRDAVVKHLNCLFDRSDLILVFLADLFAEILLVLIDIIGVRLLLGSPRPVRHCVDPYSKAAK